MQSQHHAVKVLNSLIETTLDSANGYRDAAEGAESPPIRSLLSRKASTREELSRRLQSEVRSFGGEPETDQSAMGKAHNVFTELKGKIMGRDDESVLAEVDRGESFIEEKFEAASRDPELPDHVRRLIESECAAIRTDHEEMKRMKSGMH
ncbi:PA2169 family four-helix-bundle protein [Brevundimonas sp.]|uniref:ferritin-like domain-containing protein n=1 Tax=Brevundimonas sp. TaxID=1871086 RepID=UPI002D72D352|nr:PA2169 family four-helix-bundle protein [Brevundimonas sp.]HYC75833.1 PA2169 family four-helix-bundle protein [Brevundimonas sp.]